MTALRISPKLHHARPVIPASHVEPLAGGATGLRGVAVAALVAVAR